MITFLAPSFSIALVVSLGREFVAASRIGALRSAASGTPASASAKVSPFARTTVSAPFGKAALAISAAVPNLLSPAIRSATSAENVRFAQGE